jgi:hypothetical protein
VPWLRHLVRFQQNPRANGPDLERSYGHRSVHIGTAKS